MKSYTNNIKFENIEKCYSWFKKLRGIYFKNKSSIIVMNKCKCVHTLFFIHNIDVAFLNKEHKVLKSIKNMPPWRFAYCKKAYYVIEKFSNDDTWYEEGSYVL